MTKFSANLGFLWTDRPLPRAIIAAKSAGFDAVECHWPYDTPAHEVKSALEETGLTMLGLNTTRGDVAAGDNGLSAIPDRVDESRATIDQAIAYAREIGAKAVHVMAGFAEGSDAHACFVANLEYACRQAPELTMLIEPLNRHDAPGYFLANTDQVQQIIADAGMPNLKLMFDCYHIGRTEGDLLTRFNALRESIGHVQFASVPDRGVPDHGEINYAWLFKQFDALGWKLPLGAEYKPAGATDDTLAWLTNL